MDGEQKWTFAVLPVSGSVLHYWDSHCLVPCLGRPLKPAFHHPPLPPPSLQLIGMVAQAAEGLACTAAALSPAARYPASPPIAVQSPWARPAGRVLQVGCLGWGCGFVPAEVQVGGCYFDGLVLRQGEKLGNEGGEWQASGRSVPGTL